MTCPDITATVDELAAVAAEIDLERANDYRTIATALMAQAATSASPAPNVLAPVAIAAWLSSTPS